MSRRVEAAARPESKRLVEYPSDARMLESRTAAESRFRGGLEGAPDPIVLHVANLPRKDGREVLPDIKADPDLKTIPVVVLTTSRADQDVLQTYALQANCYITKPLPHKP